MSDRLEDRRTSLIWVHSSIDDMTNLSPNAMRVYMHLVRRANGQGVAWPSYQSVGDHCFSSISDKPATRKSFARSAIDQLIEAGLIRKEERIREDGSQTSNAYVLVNPDPSTPVLNKHPHANEGTPRAYKAPVEGNSIEGNPNKKDDEDNARARGDAAVFKAWTENIPGTMTPILSERLHDLTDECGERAVIHGIVASVEAGARNFNYIAKCARNHAAGVEPATRHIEHRRQHNGKGKQGFGAGSQPTDGGDHIELDPEIQRRMDEQRERRKAEGSTYFNRTNLQLS